MASEAVAKYEPANPVSIIDNVNVQQVSATMQKIAQFQAVVQKTLKKDHDYGVIPGTGNKPTLLKPGAEKILMLMGLTSEYEVIEKVQDYENGFFAFTVKCALLRQGLKITEGVGHANTRERRYTRVKEGKEPQDPYTLANTVLKMAKKRAQVDAALTVASLSEVFTQDLEDMDLPTGNVTPPPSRGPAPAPKNGGGITDPQKKKIFAMSKSLGVEPEQMKGIIKELFGKESSGDLTKQEASKLIEHLSTLEADGEGDETQETAGQ